DAQGNLEDARRSVRSRPARGRGRAIGGGRGPPTLMALALHPGAFVDERAKLGVDVSVGPGAVIGPHVSIGDGTSVGSHALLTGWTRIGKGCQLHHGAVLGSPPPD